MEDHGAQADGYQNGQIPADKLTPIPGGGRLYGDAARAWMQLYQAAQKDGVSIKVTDSYRSYEAQVDVARRKGLYSKGGLAAEPGKSRHGWGTAVDIDNHEGGAGAWMRQNAHRFGFETIPREPWHWQYNGSFRTNDGAEQSHSPPADSRSQKDQSPNKAAEVGKQHSNDEKEIKGADSSRWSIPDSPDVSHYPRQTTTRDSSGNIISASYQPGGERISFVHGKTASYIEIDASGNTVRRSDGDIIEHSAGNIRVSSKNHIAFASQDGSIRAYAGDKLALESGGSVHIGGKGEWDLTSTGNMTIKVGGQLVIDAASVKIISGGGPIDIRSEGNVNVESNGEMNLSAQGPMAMETADNMFQKTHGDWTAHASGKGTLGSDGDASIKSDGKIKVQGAEYHNKSPKAVFDKGSFDELHSTTLNWRKTKSTARYAQDVADAEEKPSTNFGAPIAADKPLDNVNKRNKAISEESEGGEQVKGAGTGYGKKEKGGVARSAEANPVVPNPRPKSKQTDNDSSTKEKSKYRPHFLDVAYQEYDSSTVSDTPNQLSQALYIDGDGSNRGIDYNPGISLTSIYHDTNQASGGISGIGEQARETPIQLVSIGNSEQPPSQQLKKGGEYRGTVADSEGLRKAAQLMGPIPKTSATSAMVQKAIESQGGATTGSEAQFGKNPVNKGKGTWFGQFGYGPYGAGQSQYKWVDKGDNGQNKYGDPQTTPGIALPSIKDAGKYYNVKAPNGRILRLKVVDRGPRNSIYEAETGTKATTNAQIDINAPAAELFGYSPQTFPSGAQFEFQLADDQTPGADYSFPQRLGRVDQTNRTFSNSAGGARLPAVAAGVLSARGFSPNVAQAWGLSHKDGRWNRSINWLLKNTQGIEQAGWKEFSSKYKGKVQDPSFTPIELVKTWINTLGAPWPTLAGALSEFLPMNKNVNIQDLLNGKFDLGSLSNVATKLAQKTIGGHSSYTQGSFKSYPDATVATGNTNVSVKSNTFTYDPKDGADATSAIMLMKSLFNMDHKDETWDRNTFDVTSEYVIKPDPTNIELDPDKIDPNVIKHTVKPFKLDITIDDKVELRRGLNLSPNITIDALTTGATNMLSYPIKTGRVEHLIENQYFTENYINNLPDNLKGLYSAKWKIANNLQHLAQGAVEPLVDAFGKDLLISSAFINSGLNSNYPKSIHGTGEALDIVIPEFGGNMFLLAGELMSILKNRNVVEIGLCFNQSSWVHIGIAGGYSVYGGNIKKPRFFTRDFATGEMWSGFYPARGLTKEG